MPRIQVKSPQHPVEVAGHRLNWVLEPVYNALYLDIVAKYVLQHGDRLHGIHITLPFHQVSMAKQLIH